MVSGGVGDDGVYPDARGVMRLIIMLRSILFLSVLVLTGTLCGQDRKETGAWFDRIKSILADERSGGHLLYRLDTLRSEFIPSRSGVNDYFNRDVDFGYRHRRINVELNFSRYQLDLLCFNDTICLSSLTTEPYTQLRNEAYDRGRIERYLQKRNKFYRSGKGIAQLIGEISLDEEYAFNCGDGDPETAKGKYINQLAEDGNIAALTGMLKSFNCETQAYGVAGFRLLEHREIETPPEEAFLIRYIKKRNSELKICSGCLGGLIERIYSEK
jgi:hypothetical protein